MSAASDICYTNPMQRSRTAPAATRYTLDTSSSMSRTTSRNRRARMDARPFLAPTRPRAERKPTANRVQTHHVREAAASEDEPLPSPIVDERENWPHVRAPPPGVGLGLNLPDLTDLATGRAFIVLAQAGMRGLRGDNGGHGPVSPFAWAVKF